MKTYVPPAHRLTSAPVDGKLPTSPPPVERFRLLLVHRRCRSENYAPPEHNLFVSVGDTFLRDMMARG